MKERPRLQLLKNFLLITFGCVLFALSYVLFLQPHRIAPGGISGLSMAVAYLTSIPMGVGILLLNIPLFSLALWKFGIRFLGSTLYATVLSSVLIDLLGRVFPLFTEDLLLASLYGGLLMGSGLGLVFVGGATTGGSDIVSKLIRLRFPHVKIGRILLVVDTVIVIICAIIFRDINLALYAAITLYVSATVIDTIIYGSDYAALCFIISEKPDEVCEAILGRLERGATYLSGTGGHTMAGKRIIMCAVRRSEATVLNELVEKIDSSAFMIVTEARQVFGTGFLPYSKR